VKNILLAIVMMCPIGLWAQALAPLDIKPGLWENTTVSQISGVSMPAMQLTPDQMAKLPPQARAQIEAMQKGAPQTHTSRSCYTKDQLSKPLFETGDKACTYKLTNSSSSTQTIHVECLRGNTKTAGDITLDRVDPEHLKGDMLMKTTGDSSTNGSIGQNMTIKISFTNKFISSDCGDVKPGGGEK
jgi:hypothetical protein